MRNEELGISDFGFRIFARRRVRGRARPLCHPDRVNVGNEWRDLWGWQQRAAARIS